MQLRDAYDTIIICYCDEKKKGYIYFTMKINLLIKGILVGIAKIVPGFSGAILMISFGLYDKTIEAITNFFVHPKKNFSFLFFLCIGIMIGIVLFSRVISYFLISDDPSIF